MITCENNDRREKKEHDIKLKNRMILFAAIVLFAFIFMPGGLVNHVQVYAGTATLNSTEVTLYALDDWAEEYISIPSGYKQSFTIKINGKTSTLDWTSEDSESVYVDSKGVIRIGKMQVYNLTYGAWQEKYNFDVPIKLTATYGSETLEITVTIKNYAEVYAQQVAEKFVKEKITASMTDMQKLEQICAFVSSYKYSVDQYTMTGMLVAGGGDCWASAETVNYLCGLVGITAGYRPAGGDLITLSGGHMNNYAVIDGVTYIVESTASGDSNTYLISKVTKTFYCEEKEDGTLKITGYEGYASTVTIPATIDGKTVTEIGDYAFYGHFELEKVVMADTITTMGEGVFYTCINLKTVILSESLKEISYGAFYFTNISKIVVPESVTAIDEYAFLRYSDYGTLKYIELPNSITSIGIDLSDAVVLYHGNSTKWSKISFSTSSYKPSGSNIYYNAYGVAVTDTEVCIGKGETKTLSYYTASSSLSWTSSDDSIVSVSGGKITAKEKGAATITVVSKDNGVKTGSMVINITVKNAQSISVTSSMSITYGDSATALGATCKGNATLSYSSSNSKVVKVSSAGKITPVAAGSATITITSGETSSYAPTTVKVKVKVNKKSIANCHLIFTKAGSIPSETSDDYIAIADGTTILTEGVDYTWSAGGATLTSDVQYVTSAYRKITGKGNYTGTVTLESSTITATSVLNSAYRTSSGIKLTWKKETGAMGYRIYRKKGNGSYSLVKTISSYSTTSWTDKDVSTSSGYTYYVKAFTKNSNGIVCAKKSNTKTVAKYLSTPKLSSVADASTGLEVSWGKVSGASKYFVYRKTSSGSWTKIATTSSTSYIDKKASNGTKYWYTVCCATSDGKGLESAYNTSGKSTVRVITPTLSSVKNSSSKKMNVKWAKNSKATGYQIQYSTSSSFASGNKTVTVSGASNVSKVISSLTKGKTYYVRVRAYKTVSGTKYYSAWSSKKSVKISK